MGDWNYVAYALIGLFGGGHCVGMCGPFAMVGVRPGGGGQLRWWWLNVFRVLGYALLGLLAGVLGAGSHGFGRWHIMQLALYGAAQAMLVGMGLQLAGWPTFVTGIERGGARLWRKLSPRFTGRLQGGGWYTVVGAGLMWALLPCGLIYSALTGALAAGGALRGAVTMLAFAIGTLPTLLLMGRFAGELRAWLRHPAGRRGLGLIVIGMGCWGLARFALDLVHYATERLV